MTRKQVFFALVRKHAAFVFAMLLFLLFVYSATSKMYNPLGFEHELAKQPFPTWLQTLLLWGLPKAEIVIAAALAIGQFYPKYQRRSFLWSIVIMGIFTIYTILALSKAFGHVPCACGGIIELLNWKQHLIFNSFFLGIAIWGYLRSMKTPVKERRAATAANYRANVQSS